MPLAEERVLVCCLLNYFMQMQFSLVEKLTWQSINPLFVCLGLIKEDYNITCTIFISYIQVHTPTHKQNTFILCVNGNKPLKKNL